MNNDRYMCIGIKDVASLQYVNAGSLCILQYFIKTSVLYTFFVIYLDFIFQCSEKFMCSIHFTGIFVTPTIFLFKLHVIQWIVHLKINITKDYITPTTTMYRTIQCIKKFIQEWYQSSIQYTAVTLWIYAPQLI